MVPAGKRRPYQRIFHDRVKLKKKHVFFLTTNCHLVYEIAVCVQNEILDWTTWIPQSLF